MKGRAFQPNLRKGENIFHHSDAAGDPAKTVEEQERQQDAAPWSQ